LVLCFVMPEVNNTNRSIHMFGLRFHPSSLAKLSLILFLASYLSRKKEKLHQFKTLIIPAAVMFVFIILIIKEPDYSTSLFIFIAGSIMLFIGGIRIDRLFLIGLISAILFVFYLFQANYRLDRWNSYVSPSSDLLGSGFHAYQSKLAVGSGGILGVSIAQSTQKLFFLPCAHTDYIYSIIGEELGLIGTISVIFLFAGCAGSDKTENWTHFRGSEMDGRAQTATTPLEWSETSNIVWKTAVKGKGYSSPVIYGNQIWITSATDDGKEFYILCYDFETGELLNEKTIFTSDDPQRIHSTNSYATPTSCIEDGFVYVHFGTFGTACIDTKTFDVVWKREDLKCEHMQGPASSPILHKNMLILHLEGTHDPYVVALDKKTGETIWKSVRLRPAGTGLPQIVSNAHYY